MITPTLSKEKFDELPVNEKRIAICKDVIARINQSFIVPTNGYFWSDPIPYSVEEQGYSATLDYRDDVTLKERINSEPCSVCAKGAMFCSWVGNFNQVEWRHAFWLEEVDDLKNTSPELVEIFGREMLDNIEAAFESEAFSWHYSQRHTEKYAEAFEEYDLKSIMQYIIEHKGEFPLPK